MWTSPPELTTAITDLAILPFTVIFCILIKDVEDRYYKRMWRITFAVMGTSGVGGFIAHGVLMSPRTKDLCWIPLQIIMTATVLCFAVITLYDITGGQYVKRIQTAAAIWFATASVLTTVLILTENDYFYIFIVSAIICVGSGLVVYPVLISKGKKHAVWMLAGVIIQAVGILPRAFRQPVFTVVWEFDYNSIYHILAIVSLFFFLKGIKIRNGEKTQQQ